MTGSFAVIMLMHMVLVGTALFWAWRRGHLSREQFPVESILGIDTSSKEADDGKR